MPAYPVAIIGVGRGVADRGRRRGAEDEARDHRGAVARPGRRDRSLAVAPPLPFPLALLEGLPFATNESSLTDRR